MNAVAAFPVRGHFIANADVGEGAAHHYFVVAAPGAVGVELGHIDAVLLQVLPGGAVRLDGTSRGDVVGGHRIAQQGQKPRAPHLHALIEVIAHGEEGRLLDVGGVQPAVGAGVLHFDGPPSLRAGKDVGVVALKHLRGDPADGFGHLGRGGPDVAQMHGFAIGANA